VLGTKEGKKSGNKKVLGVWNGGKMKKERDGFANLTF
jgi:hypothetical protein